MNKREKKNSGLKYYDSGKQKQKKLEISKILSLWIQASCLCTVFYKQTCFGNYTYQYNKFKSFN